MATAPTPRFEIVTTNAPQPYHARLIAANGEPVWWTESYADKLDAFHAVDLLRGAQLASIVEVDERG